MKQKINSRFLLTIGISLTLLACNTQQNKEASADSTATDTSSNQATAETPAQENIDAAKVAPTLYTVAKDTMGIRVLKITYKPGDSSALHSHPDNVLYVIDGGKGEFTEKDGTKDVRELKSGMIMTQAASTHSVKNVGKTTLKAILVEVNRPNTTGTAVDPALDAVKVAPTLYKKVSDTMNIKVVMATYKPGASSALHAHADYAIYTIQGGKAEFTSKDGTKQVNDLPTGAVLIKAAEQHSVKNVGNSTIKVLLVEVNRPAQ